MKENKSGWQFPKALEIIKCKEGNKEFMKERPARRPFGNTVLICEYPIDIPTSPYPDGDKGVLACPNCGSGEYLHNADENENAFCGQCGQAIKWGCEDED